MSWVFLAALLAVLVLSAFFSGSETALTAVRLHRLRPLEAKNRRAAAVLRVAAQPERFLGAILTGNVFTNAIAGVLVTIVLTTGVETPEGRARAATAATLLVGAALLIVGEMIPKSIASRHAEGWSLRLIRPVQAVLWLFGPISAALSWFVTNLLRGFGVSRPAREAGISAAEMRASLRYDPLTGDGAEKQVLVRLAEATGRRLTEVMTPRRAIVSVPLAAGLSETMRLFRKHGHTRMPVAGDSLDDIRGLVDVRDALHAIETGQRFEVANRLLPARFSPGTATLARALLQMHEQSCRMLIVVDEHGGVEGLVTSVSLLDAIPGESAPAGAGSRVLLPGTLSVSEANAELQSRGPASVEIPEGDDYDTVAGFVLQRTGRIPRPGETAPIPGGIVRVVEVEGHRIVRLRVEPAAEDADGDGA